MCGGDDTHEECVRGTAPMIREVCELLREGVGGWDDRECVCVCVCVCVIPP